MKIQAKSKRVDYGRNVPGIEIVPLLHFGSAQKPVILFVEMSHAVLSIIGTRIASVTYDEAVAIIFVAARAPAAHAYVCAVSVHGLAMARKDPAFRQVLNGSILNVPDGKPLVWSHRLLGGRRLPDRVYGPTLMLRLCEAAAKEKVPIYLYGAASGVPEQLRDSLITRFPGLIVAGAFSPPYGDRKPDDPALLKEIDAINASGARLLFVGLGAPRQEIFMHAQAGRINPVQIGVGAAFDFHTGRLSQAPRWIQSAGLEWFYRLCAEPRRLWRRYLFSIPYFLIHLFLQKLGLDSVSEAGT